MVGNDRMAIMLVDTAFLKAEFSRFCFREHVFMMVRDAWVRNCTVEYLSKSRDENRESQSCQSKDACISILRRRTLWLSVLDSAKSFHGEAAGCDVIICLS